MSSETVSRSTDTNSIQVISRAADILKALKADNSGLSLGQIAERVSLPRSTVQRIVNALLYERLLVINTNKGGVQLGPEIQSLAAAGRLDVVNVVRPVLTELVRQTEETVDLAEYRHDHMVFIDQVVGTQRLRTVSAVGEEFPLTCTANGKASLALLDDESVIEILEQLRGKPNESTKSLDVILKELKTVRVEGVAFDIDEHADGISAVGAAFRTSSNQLFSISIPVPSPRFASKREKLVSLLQASVAEIQRLF